jgi:hypothetical protein
MQQAKSELARKDLLEPISEVEQRESGKGQGVHSEDAA